MRPLVEIITHGGKRILADKKCAILAIVKRFDLLQIPPKGVLCLLDGPRFAVARKVVGVSVPEEAAVGIPSTEEPKNK